MNLTGVDLRVSNDVIVWAINRSGLSVDEIAQRVRGLPDWLEGNSSPTVREIEKLAKATRTPFGNFFLVEPPEIVLPMIDFRTKWDEVVREPSPELIEVIGLCEMQQEWYRDYAVSGEFDPIALVGSLDVSMDFVTAATELASFVSFNNEIRSSIASLDEAWNALSTSAEDAGVLVMKSGVVGNNTHRTLNEDEFRGFALCDEFAPLVFVNGSDSRAATIFTLVHELVHIGLGQSSISNLAGPDSEVLEYESKVQVPSIERWCSRVAAEFLVPATALRQALTNGQEIGEQIHLLSRTFKVSKFVVLRKLLDDGLISWDSYFETRSQIADAWAARPKPDNRKAGGDAYRTMAIRFSRTFSRTLLYEARNGRTSYGEALRLLSLSKAETITKFAQRLGID